MSRQTHSSGFTFNPTEKCAKSSLGDGIVAWFGYPTASEWDAECALRAALEIVTAMDTLKLPGGFNLDEGQSQQDS